MPRIRSSDRRGEIMEDGIIDSSERSEIGLSDFDYYMADAPIVGGLLGSASRRDAALAALEEERNRGYWEDLSEYMPSADTLTPTYNLENRIRGPGTEWDTESERAEGGRLAEEASMDSLNEWARGGFTDADRAMMGETSRAASMDARADREAALSALEARGAGGSGASLAADLSAGEAAADRASTMNTSLLGAAQQRQINANRERAALGGAIRDDEARATAGREAYNQWDTEYDRGRETRNTNTTNRERDRRADAYQTEYENRERATAGVTNQYSTDTARRAREGDEVDEDNANLLGLVEGLFGG